MLKIKKIGALALVVILILALASCGTQNETKLDEKNPDYSKICFHGPNIHPISQLTDVKDRDGIMECFRILKSMQVGNLYTAKITLIPEGFEDVDYSDLEISVEFSLETMKLEEIAESLEKISAIPNVTAIDCYFSYVATPLPDLSNP